MLDAIFGLIGVLVGAGIAWAQSWFAGRKTRLESARYLAIRVVCLLDMYVDKCTDVVCDDGLSFGQRNQDGYLEAQVPAPPPIEYPNDVDWRTIQHDLMYELLALPNRADAAINAISFAGNIAYPPDFDEYFEARRRHFTDLGLRSAALAARLRSAYKIPALAVGDWSPTERLNQERRALEELDARRASQGPPDFLNDNA